MPDNRKKGKEGELWALGDMDWNNSRRVSEGSKGRIVSDVFGYMDGFEVSFKNMSKTCSWESNLPFWSWAWDKPNTDMKC